MVHAKTLRVLASNLRAVLVEITSCVGISSFCARLSMSWSRLLACSTSGTTIILIHFYRCPYSTLVPSFLPRRSRVLQDCAFARRVAHRELTMETSRVDGDRKIVSCRVLLVLDAFSIFCKIYPIVWLVVFEELLPSFDIRRMQRSLARPPSLS